MTGYTWRTVFLMLGVMTIFAIFGFFSVPAGAQSNGAYDLFLQGQNKRSPSFRQESQQKDLMSGPGMAGDMMSRGMISGDNVSSGGLSYQVHVLGEVESPGTYRVVASERLAEILKRAGGVNSNGSERWIELKRDGKVVKKVDLLKFERFGQLDHNPYLLDNDVVFVPLKANTIRITGAVKRPDEYEVRGEKSLKDIITLAGDYSTGAIPDAAIRVVRFTNGKKDVIEVIEGLDGFQVRNGDVIYVPNVITKDNQFDYNVVDLPGGNVFYPSFEDRVFVLGGVNNPGAYPFSPYYNIHQYVSISGGFTKMSTGKMYILKPNGKKIRVKDKKQITINPGDTILVDHRRIPPEGWIGITTGLAGFGLSTTATVLTLTR